jgi:imidazole glycerol phosphate synthase subunit HisF
MNSIVNYSLGNLTFVLNMHKRLGITACITDDPKVSSIVIIPVVACEGAGSEIDLRNVRMEGGASAVAGSSMFAYQKKMGTLVFLKKN